MELGLGVGLLSKWNGLLFIFIANERIITFITYSMPGPIFLFYAP